MLKTGKIVAAPPDTVPSLDDEIVTFEGLLAEQDGLSEEHNAIREQIQAEWDETQARIWKEHKGKRKYPGSVIACQELSELADVYLKLQDELREVLRLQTKESTRLLVRVKACAGNLSVPITEGEPLVEWATVSSSSYSTQGYGAMKYARQAAEAKADKARMYGLTPVIEEVNFSPAKGMNSVNHADFKILLNTTDTGLVLLGYKPDLSLREWVKACWGRGCQPRVSYSGLAHNYEEKNGLDYFGHEKGEEGYIASH